MEFPRKEFWNELPFPSPGDLPNPGIEPMSLAWQGDSLPLSPQGNPISSLQLKNRMRVMMLKDTNGAEFHDFNSKKWNFRMIELDGIA